MEAGTHKEEDNMDSMARLAGVQLPVMDIALTSKNQIQKLEVILEELDKRLGLQDSSQIKWNVKFIHNKDLLATIHLLVAMVSKSGFKSEVQMEALTEESNTGSNSLSNTEMEDPIKKLLMLEADKVNTVKKAILHFVNQNMSNMGLQVDDMDKQFSDGVILLLLIGQLEGFFVPLYDFNLIPVNESEMLHNVTLALDLLNDTDMQLSSVDPQDIVSQDIAATFRILYTLFKKHKGK
ncbi:hypothetical protein PAMP_020008 [Pampus punctatissimus]